MPKIILILLLKNALVQYCIDIVRAKKIKHLMSAFDLRNISENFRVEILSNVISVTNMSRERVTQNFIPMKLKGLQAEKC